MSSANPIENAIFDCFAAAECGSSESASLESFVDVEEYENQVMYPSFARLARQAGYPDIASLFLKVAGEEKLHAKWLREHFQNTGEVPEGNDTRRAKAALRTIENNLETLLKADPHGLVEKALRVSYAVEMRESTRIYPGLRDQARAAGNEAAAALYQRVIDSETQHAGWFQAALDNLPSRQVA
jgi:rubrerythrin